MRFALVVAFAAVAMIVAGCTRLPPADSMSDDGLSAAQRELRLRAADHWEMRGRLAVDTGERAFQARFRWAQADDDLTLTVRGPLGAGSFEISGNADRLTVISRGEQRELSDPEADLSALFGWWLPVTSLPAWLLGLADDAFPARVERGASGLPDGFEQRRWRIDYDAFQLADAIAVPREIRMVYQPLSLTVLIEDWVPAAPPASTLN